MSSSPRSTRGESSPSSLQSTPNKHSFTILEQGGRPPRPRSLRVDEEDEQHLNLFGFGLMSAAAQHQQPQPEPPVMSQQQRMMMKGGGAAVDDETGSVCSHQSRGSVYSYATTSYSSYTANGGRHHPLLHPNQQQPRGPSSVISTGSNGQGAMLLTSLHTRHHIRPEELDLSTSYSVDWVQDEAASSCFVCDKAFSLMRRKHHCRACGQVVCKPCSLAKVPVPGLKGLQRACNRCVEGVIKPPVREEEDDSEGGQEEEEEQQEESVESETSTRKVDSSSAPAADSKVATPPKPARQDEEEEEEEDGGSGSLEELAAVVAELRAKAGIDALEEELMRRRREKERRESNKQQRSTLSKVYAFVLPGLAAVAAVAAVLTVSSKPSSARAVARTFTGRN